MADSNITVSGLAPTSGTQQIKWKWAYNDPNKGGLPYLEFEAVEVWTAASNNRNLATKAGEGITDFIEPGLTRGQIRFGWARARNKAGGFGDFHPLGVANGIEGRESNTDFDASANGWYQVPNGPLFQWGLTTSDANGDAVVEFPKPWTNGQLLRWLGSAAGGTDIDDIYSVKRHTTILVGSIMTLLVKTKKVQMTLGVAEIVDAPNLPIEWFAIGL